MENWTIKGSEARRNDAPTPTGDPVSNDVHEAATVRRCGNALYVEHVDGHTSRVPKEVIKELFPFG